MVQSTITVRNTPLDDDEHTWYAIVFIQPDITMNKVLKYRSSSNKLEAKFKFWSNSPLDVDEKYLVVLAAVQESEEIDGMEYKIVPKTSSAHEIVDFDFH